MAKKNKYTEGVLARDREDVGGNIVFFCDTDGHVARRRHFRMDRDGVWDERPLSPCCRVRAKVWWSEAEWAEHYKASDIPRWGSAFECFLEM